MKLTQDRESAGFRWKPSIVRGLLIGCAALALALPAPARGRYFGGGIGFGPAFGPWGYGYGYGPYSYMGAYPMGMPPNAGQIKLDTKDKDASIFINGALVGSVRDFKSFYLHQGNYNFEVRSPNGASYTQRIFVVNGKTLHIRPGLPPAKTS